MRLHPEGLIQDLLFLLLLKDDLSLLRVSGVPLCSPLSVFWVCMVCSLHPHVADPGSDTFNFNCSAAGAAKSLQSYPTLCDSRDGSPPGSPIPGTVQARTLEWVAISFSNAGK